MKYPDNQREDYHDHDKPAPSGAWIAWVLLAAVAFWLIAAFVVALRGIV